MYTKDQTVNSSGWNYIEGRLADASNWLDNAGDKVVDFFDRYAPHIIGADLYSSAKRGVNQFLSAFPSVSAEDAVDTAQQIVEKGRTFVDSMLDPNTSGMSNGSTSTSRITSGRTVSGVPSDALSYIDADLARAYGMSSGTAYQEALANTAYQRAVADMRKAGLNPAALFGSGRGSTASGVSYIAPASGSGVASSGSKSNYMFSSGAYNGLSAIAGLVSSAITRNPGNFYMGQTAAKGIMSMLNDLSR